MGARRLRDAPKKEIWSSLLKSVSSGKRLPEKQLLVLGGSPSTQHDFLESLSTDTSPRRDRTRKPPIANQFALGYTYQDVLDADHEDTLARLSIYTLSDPSPAFTPLLKPLLTPRTLPNTLVVILLDWSSPWLWAAQLRDWIRLLRGLVISLDDECKDALEANVIEWRDRKRGAAGPDGAPTNSYDDEVQVPLGAGEWDEPLGVPLCVVCQNADKIVSLERERGWRDEQFDFIAQFVRTVLLKHGASLIYTMPEAPGALQTLVHSSLGIQSMLLKKQLKHNVADKDHILVPPNWDSWGKIRLMTDGFDVEGVSQAWSEEIQLPAGDEDSGSPSEEEDDTAVGLYEDTIRDPKTDLVLPGLTPKNAKGFEIESKDTQAFLSEQIEMLERLRAEDEREKLVRDAKKAPMSVSYLSADEGRNVEEHIGPVQFNMGGIQVDADDMLKRLKDREASRAAELEPKSPTLPADKEMDTQKLANFFSSLMKKSGSSAASSPRRDEV
ncbi:dynein family protein [Trichodelitschia bisporula]|uniref:Dynein family protein n=1 Tax=Trichodelitschia bisporula TaxID=703511 RepID=A0A6G1HQ15_9PEZI|nr:dynein family protein [Trichodelitschia bisporula]